jgi:hypothetical protein
VVSATKIIALRIWQLRGQFIEFCDYRFFGAFCLFLIRATSFAIGPVQ